MNKTLLALGIITMLTLQGCTAKAPQQMTPAPSKQEVKQEQPVSIAKLTSINLKDAGVEMSNYNQDMVVSPDGQYVVFSGTTFAEGTYKATSRLYLMDIKTESFSVIDTAEYMNVIAWQPQAKGILYTAAEELRYYGLAKQEVQTISKPRALYGAFDPEGERIVYPRFDSGLWVYDFRTKINSQLTKENEPWYPTWYPDGKSILYITDLGEQLGDGAGSLQGIAKVDVESQKVTRLVADEEGKYRKLEWIVPGESAYLLGGWDDGFFKSILDLKTDKVVHLGEDTDMTDVPLAVVAGPQKQLWDAKGNLVTVHNQTGKAQGQVALSDELGTKATALAIAPKGDRYIYAIGKPGDFGYVEQSQLYVSKLEESKQAVDLPAGNYVQPQWLPNGTVVVVLELPDQENKEGVFKLHLVPVK